MADESSLMPLTSRSISATCHWICATSSRSLLGSVNGRARSHPGVHHASAPPRLSPNHPGERSAGALRLAIDTIRWSVDWTIRETRYIDAHWLPMTEDVGHVIELAQALDDCLEHIVTYDDETSNEDRDNREDARLIAIAMTRALTSTGELVDLDDVASDLDIELEDPLAGPRF